MHFYCAIKNIRGIWWAIVNITEPYNQNQCRLLKDTAQVLYMSVDYVVHVILLDQAE